jgi:hypothetical protein
VLNMMLSRNGADRADVLDAVAGARATDGIKMLMTANAEWRRSP